MIHDQLKIEVVYWDLAYWLAFAKKFAGNAHFDINGQYTVYKCSFS